MRMACGKKRNCILSRNRIGDGLTQKDALVAKTVWQVFCNSRRRGLAHSASCRSVFSELPLSDSIASAFPVLWIPTSEVTEWPPRDASRPLVCLAQGGASQLIQRHVQTCGLQVIFCRYSETLCAKAYISNKKSSVGFVLETEDGAGSRILTTTEKVHVSRLQYDHSSQERRHRTRASDPYRANHGETHRSSNHPSDLLPVQCLRNQMATHRRQK